MNNIPKILHHIWIGPKKPPIEWMQTWKDKHPDWEYILWDNERVFNTFGTGWTNLKHIEEMMMNKRYAGAADLLRYEILFNHGGYVAAADSICLRNIEDLFDDQHDAYTVYENEIARPGLVSPLMAASKGNEFAAQLIVELHDRANVDGEPWQVTGNLFMQEMIEKHKPERLKIWPSIVLIPEHYTGEKGQGDLPTYATHEWGSKGNVYPDDKKESV